MVDRNEQENLAAARATLKRSSIMLFSASKTYLRHPEIPSARENRDFVFGQVRHAINVIASTAQGQLDTSKHNSSPSNPIGDLTRAINEFDVSIFGFFKRTKLQDKL